MTHTSQTIRRKYNSQGSGASGIESRNRKVGGQKEKIPWAKRQMLEPKSKEAEKEGKEEVEPDVD